jgi:hypothetical protein
MISLVNAPTDLVVNAVKANWIFARLPIVTMEPVLTNFSDMNAFVNPDGLAICVMSTSTTATPILVKMPVNALMPLMISTVSANKDLRATSVNTKLIIVMPSPVKMVELARTLKPALSVNAGPGTTV